jgi:V-type H+-transporting ATPase subunit a
MELGTYHTLNKLDIRDTGVAVGKGWVLASAAEDVASMVRRAGENSGGGASINESPQPWPTPPTYFKTNKYTGTFQGIVNTYGVPKYQEANPAIVTLITFPFSFAIMFGDVGHGLCWLIASIYMILAEKSLTSSKLNETVAMVVNARYMLCLMAFFAVYNGFIYNDTFALGVTYFSESKWNVSDTDGVTTVVQDGVYPFGLDPIWKISTNEILFGNSLKMKISVTFGVLHMVLGVFFKGSNTIFFRNWNGFFCEFLPQVIFILSFFGYMIFMIFLKWCTDWAEVGKDFPGSSAPSLITTLVNIALAPGSIDNTTKLYGFGVNNNLQANVQVYLLIVAVICIPWMLVPKPLIENCANKRKAQYQALHNNHTDEEGGASHHDDDDDDDEHGAHEVHSCSDLFIHQVIETIEYVLGCISNTASYLRLWALSLAHMELSKTFWDLIMVNVLNLTVGTTLKAILVFCAYSVFAAITLGVLLAMDFLECFLHALRLHWVEFQNKFFAATGYAFEAFSFDQIVKDAQADEDSTD